eukprot:877582-Pyramimonas_sp.AAC.1
MRWGVSLTPRVLRKLQILDRLPQNDLENLELDHIVPDGPGPLEDHLAVVIHPGVHVPGLLGGLHLES